ncbi:g6336 [Coccomyxa elongata]
MLLVSLMSKGFWQGHLGLATLRVQLSQRHSRCQAGRRNNGNLDWASPGGHSGAETSAQLRGKVESESIPQALRRRIEGAVEALGGRVTVGDVAARAGASLEDTERTLNALAADSQGVLQVSDAGDVLYVLPQNFKSIIQGRSWLLKLEPALARAKAAAGYAVRVSFGTALVASIVLVSLTIIAILTASSSSDRDNRRNGGYNGGYYSRSPFSTFINLSDLFLYWDPYYYRRRGVYTQNSGEMNFFESVFSFVFGDGNPNLDYDEQRWKLVGQLIQSKGGVVTAEQLAPFLDVTPDDLEKVDGYTNESYVVPALVRFNGHPEVSQGGQLLYVFPSLQRTAKAKRQTIPPAKDAALERRWGFSSASEGQRLGAVALGVANCVGVLYLGSLLGSPGVSQMLAQSSLGFMNGLFPFLQAYAASFFAIPAIRWFFNQRKNSAIEARNQARLDAIGLLKRPSVQVKLAAAGKLAERVVIQDRDLIYSSDRDLAAQQTDTDTEGRYFDERLRERELARKAAARSPMEFERTKEIRQTLGNLDALLGIEEDEKGKPKEKTESEGERSSPMGVGIAPEVLRQLAEAEAARRPKSTGPEDVKELEKQMMQIAETAKRAASGSNEKESEALLRVEFERLLQILRPESVMDKEDLQNMKDKVFGPQTFFVTETRLTDDFAVDAGWLIRGNLRAKKEEVLEIVDQGVHKLFGDKYSVLLVEDPDAEEEDARGGPRVAFQIMPRAAVEPAPAPGWQNAAAAVLFLFTIGSCLQLGLAANVSLLPKEILDWLSRPENLQADSLPPFIENFDAVPYIISALPISGSVLGINVLHEVVQRTVAATKQIKLGPPLFVPNGQLGSFGALSQLKSLVRNRTDLFDLAFSGPAASGIVSAIVFIGGLVLSASGLPKEELLPVPASLFQGSLLLGGLARTVLGPAAAGAPALVHPALVAGWCGLVVSALNLLPVGSLDGGRMIQAAYGRSVLSAASFFTYVGLGLGFLASSLSLPFGLFVFICQRNSEKYIQDSVTAPDKIRQRIATVAVVLSLLILLPTLPEAAENAGSVAPGLYL